MKSFMKFIDYKNVSKVLERKNTELQYFYLGIATKLLTSDTCYPVGNNDMVQAALAHLRQSYKSKVYGSVYCSETMADDDTLDLAVASDMTYIQMGLFYEAVSRNHNAVMGTEWNNVYSVDTDDIMYLAQMLTTAKVDSVVTDSGYYVKYNPETAQGLELGYYRYLMCLKSTIREYLYLRFSEEPIQCNGGSYFIKTEEDKQDWTDCIEAMTSVLFKFILNTSLVLCVDSNKAFVDDIFITDTAPVYYILNLLKDDLGIYYFNMNRGIPLCSDRDLYAESSNTRKCTHDIGFVESFTSQTFMNRTFNGTPHSADVLNTCNGIPQNHLYIKLLSSL